MQHEKVKKQLKQRDERPLSLSGSVSVCLSLCGPAIAARARVVAREQSVCLECVPACGHLHLPCVYATPCLWLSATISPTCMSQWLGTSASGQSSPPPALISISGLFRFRACPPLQCLPRAPVALYCDAGPDAGARGERAASPEPLRPDPMDNAVEVWQRELAGGCAAVLVTRW